MSVDWRPCPEAVHGRHGPADRDGKCPWCGRKYEAAILRQPEPWRPSELTEAYELTYDPDYGALTYDQIRERYQMGQDR